ncbi:MAG: hypothetical protein GKR90_15570 [Pseudomonadales bacterium]|nr:hypothetical protein [Pseudomonadales bacterium]
MAEPRNRSTSEPRHRPAFKQRLIGTARILVLWLLPIQYAVSDDSAARLSRLLASHAYTLQNYDNLLSQTGLREYVPMSASELAEGHHDALTSQIKSEFSGRELANILEHERRNQEVPAYVVEWYSQVSMQTLFWFANDKPQIMFDPSGVVE